MIRRGDATFKITNVEDIVLEALEEAYQISYENVYPYHATKIKHRAPKIIRKLISLVLSNFNLSLIRKDLLDLYSFNTLPPMEHKVCIGTLFDILRNPEDWNWLIRTLADTSSVAKLIKCIKHRILCALAGPIAASSKIGFKPSYLDLIRLFRATGDKIITYTIKGYNLMTHIRPLIETWFYEIYRYKDLILPKKGDTALDIGAYFGETTLWLHYYVGDSGLIYAFEPSPFAQKVLRRNIIRNNIINVSIVNKALWSYDGTLQLVADPLSHQLIHGGFQKNTYHNLVYFNVEAKTLDKILDEYHVDSVDYIKIDVEGAEEEVIKGARRVLEAHRPRLAIASYHNPRQVISIAKLIKDISEKYQLYFSHKMPIISASVLYAL